MTEADNKMRANPVAKIADELAHFLWAKGYGRNCVNCDHFVEVDSDGNKDFCRLWLSHPPAKVIVIGCDKHTDLIPF